MTAVLERPTEQEQDQDDDLIHLCCTRCWPLPGPAEAFCGVFKEWTYLVSRKDPRPRCKTCRDLTVQSTHKHIRGN